MSSYFDTMGRALHDPGHFFELVQRQYGRYLDTIRKEALVSERDRLEPIARRIEAVEIRGDVDVHSVSFAIQEMHGLAHDLGSARIKLRGHRFASDNPLGVVYY